MAFNGVGFPSGGSVFGGYPGGYNLSPAGITIAPNTNVLGLGFPSIPGSNLPNVDPNNYPGTVHFGPSTAIIGSQPLNTGFVDPNLGIIGAPAFEPGF